MASPHQGPAMPDGQTELEKPKLAVSSLSMVLASLFIFSFALYQGFNQYCQDFSTYLVAAKLAIRGENPYNIERIRHHVAATFPEENETTKNFLEGCGYFLPPMALVIFLPLAAMPTIAAKVCWALAIGVAGSFIARLPGVLRSSNSPPLSMLARSVVPFFLVLNTLTLTVVYVGQASVLLLGCVAAGLWCLDRGRPYIAAILWVVPFMKPQVAMPLLPLLWFLAGWRPAALLFVLVLALNLIGATLVSGSPLFLRDYLDFLSEAHKSVTFNRVEMNWRMTSWNRFLLSAGGPLIELNIVTTVAGYLVWLGLNVGRAALLGTRPSAPWAVAVCAVGGVLCSQALTYEMLVLTLMVPWVRDLFANGYRLRGWLAVIVLVLPLIPWLALENSGIRFPPSLGVMLLAVLVLVGPIGTSSPPLPQTKP